MHILCFAINMHASSLPTKKEKQEAKVKCIIETKANVKKESRNGTKTHVELHIIFYFYLLFTVCRCDKDRNVKSIFQKMNEK